MWQRELYIFENVPVEWYSEDMQMIINPTMIARPEIEFSKALSHSISWLKRFDFEVVQPTTRRWSIQVSVHWLNNWTCWNLCADHNGCHGLHCSLHWWCLLCNPVALPYAFPPTLSTPTTYLLAFVFVGPGVHVRLGFWGSIFSLSGVSSGGGALWTLSMGRSLVE